MMNNIFKHSQLYWFAAMLVIYEFTTYAANDMIMPGMLQVIRQFQAPVSYVAASLSIYMLGSCVLQLLLGPTAERYGRKKIILIGNSLFLLFTLVLALSASIKMFMFGRLLQGSCMAFTPLGYALIHRNFNDKQALKLTALMANIVILAPLIGPMLGGIIISYFSWRYVFILSLITGAISLWGLSKFTPSEKTNSTIVPNFQLKMVLVNYWQILKLPSFLLGVIANAVIVLPALIWVATSPTIIMMKLHLSVKDYVWCQLLAQSGLMLSSIAMQLIAGRLSLVKLMMLGLILSLSGLGLGLIFHSDLYLMVTGLAIYTFGLGLLMGVVMRIIGTLNTTQTSMLFSMCAFLQTLIMAFGLELINHCLAYYDYSLFSFTLINLLLGLIASVLIICFAYMHRKRQDSIY